MKDVFDDKKNVMISVVIPTYNRGNIIERSINSVLEQTYTNFEIIIVDDKSDVSDNTEDVINRINDKRIKFIKLSRKVYGGEARNIGVNNAKGEYIAFLDSDDEWLPNKLEIFIEAINNIKGKFLFYSSAYVKTRRMNDKIVPNMGIGIDELYINYILLNNGAIYTPTMMLQKKYALEVIWNKTLRRYQDFGYCIDFQDSGGRFYFIDKPLSVINWRRSAKINISIHSWKNGYKFWKLYKKNNNTWDIFFLKNIAEELLINRQFTLLHMILKKHNKKKLFLSNIPKILFNCTRKYITRNLTFYR